VFGKVTDGMDVVEAIENVPTANKGGQQDVPVSDVIIEKVTVQE
jgi:cyclophilin family peptidyl-prolyl cis-trans isomerase